ncbi:MAG: hypothetical protein R3B40_22420 [Polyangiales bacterium]|nr:hypothetical protein [Myxococcales bacterium]MCB9656787.1 hypothetical protein [Sandaracinaceae bacterium]
MIRTLLASGKREVVMPSTKESKRESTPQVTREAFALDAARYVRAADAGPIRVVDAQGETRMVLSTLCVADDDPPSRW